MKLTKASKKVTSRQRNKVFKKQKDHQKKMKKLGKKNPQLRKKLKKDPGIPNLWPFKQELLEEIEKSSRKEEQTDDIEEDEQDEMEETTEQQEKIVEKTKLTEMAKLALNAKKKEEEFNNKEEIISKNKDETKVIKEESLSKSSKQRYYQELKSTIEKSDVVLFVLDARDPLGCRCPDIEKTIQSQNKNMKIVFVLNKIDLVPREVLQKWLHYLRQEHPTVAFKASTQKQARISRSNDIGPAENAPKGFLKNDTCLGADSLIKLLKNYSRSEDIKRAITVGIIGYPNVGKSSIINSLKRVKAAKVGSTPGVTKQSQEFQLDKNIKLLDSPGIIFSSGQLDSDVILRNAIRVEKLEDPITPVLSIINRCRKEQLTSKYNIKDFKDSNDFLTQLSTSRGKLKKGNKPNLEETARMVLRDWNSGKIPFFTLPPQLEKEVKVESTDLDDEINKCEDLITLKDAFKQDFIPMKSSSSNDNKFVEKIDEEDSE